MGLAQVDYIWTVRWIRRSRFNHGTIHHSRLIKDQRVKKNIKKKKKHGKYKWPLDQGSNGSKPRYTGVPQDLSNTRTKQETIMAVRSWIWRFGSRRYTTGNKTMHTWFFKQKRLYKHAYYQKKHNTYDFLSLKLKDHKIRERSSLLSPKRGPSEKKEGDGGWRCSDAVVGHSAAASELFFYFFTNFFYVNRFLFCFSS